MKTDDNANAMLPKKSLNIEDTRHKISVPLAMSTNLKSSKKKFLKLSKKNEKKY